MSPGDLVQISAPASDLIGVFISYLPFDRMCLVEVLKEKNGDVYKKLESKDRGLNYLTKLKYCTVILTQKEFQPTLTKERDNGEKENYN